MVDKLFKKKKFVKQKWDKIIHKFVIMAPPIYHFTNFSVNVTVEIFMDLLKIFKFDEKKNYIRRNLLGNKQKIQWYSIITHNVPELQ